MSLSLICSLVQSLSHVWLSNPVDCSMPGFPVLHHLPELVSVMPSNHLILCHHLLLLPSVFPNIRIFSSESVLCIRWPKDWSFSFSFSPSNEYPELISLGWTDLISLQYKRLSKVFPNITVQNHQFFDLSLLCGPSLTSILDYWKNHSFY